jgi:hypothetical protein
MDGSWWISQISGGHNHTRNSSLLGCHEQIDIHDRFSAAGDSVGPSVGWSSMTEWLNINAGNEHPFSVSFFFFSFFYNFFLSFFLSSAMISTAGVGSARTRRQHLGRARVHSY